LDLLVRPKHLLQNQVNANVGAGQGIAPPEARLPGVTAAALDGAIAGLSIAEAANHIDTSVLEAIRFSTSDHLHNLASIDSYVHDHFFAAPFQSAHGWFERLTGYVVEQKAASALEAMGHHVEFAPVANQPAWDLLVDGHQIQVKEGLAGVKDFLASHSGIPIYTSLENASAVKDPLVHGLDQLDAGQIHEVTSQSLDGINDALDPGFNFPVITLALSSWREFKLLVNEMTTFERAAKNVGMDVIGVGGGAFVGAKGGAFAGAFIGGPVGAAIGGLLGAILGGVSGKMASTSVRHAPFHRARDAYSQAISQAQAAAHSSTRASQVKIAHLQTKYQAKFLVWRNQIEQRVKFKIARLQNDFNGHMFRFAEAFPCRLDDLIAQLNIEEQPVLKTIPTSGVWAYLVPTKTAHLRAAIKTWFGRAKGIVKDEKALFSKIEVRTCATLYGEIQRFLNEYNFQLDTLKEGLDRLLHAFESAQQEAQAVQENAVREMEQTRSSLVRELSREIEEIHAQIVEVVRRWNETIKSLKSDLVREGRPLGIVI
jgi:gas vesicle protein/surface antigen